MNPMVGFLVLLAIGAVQPLLITTSDPAAKSTRYPFPGWPRTFDGRPLTTLSLDEGERVFAAAFPGRIGRFTDGTREFIIRWVARPTRKLHPASDCYRALGYAVDPAPLRIDGDQRRWSGFTATRQAYRVRVSERIVDESGNGWTDVSAWYWSALLQRTAGPWWAVTVAEAAATTRHSGAHSRSSASAEGGADRRRFLP